MLNPPERRDFLLVDDNLGLFEHRIETSNLELVKPVVINSLQNVLAGNCHCACQPRKGGLAAGHVCGHS
jgi:hypothetical protein